MLVLEHEETLMTNGILLNRPTSRIITDEYSNSWNVWYGGPVRGIHDDIDSRQGEQKLAWTCLHSLTNPVAKRLSNQIIKDIQVRLYYIYYSVYTYWFMTILIYNHFFHSGRHWKRLSF
jgi:hypothetical protein